MGSDVRPTFGAARLAEETRERFVREIVARVPLERLVELYLFPAIRQGGMESGVAVLAARHEVPAVEAVTESSTEPASEPAPPAGEARPGEAESALLTDEVERDDPTEAAAGPAPDETVAEHVEADVAEPDVAPATDTDTAAAETAPDLPAAPIALDELIAEPAAADEPPPAAPAPPAPRHTVFTALYRLVIKGPERGKWDVEMRDEADAPLVSIEAVVRGVQQRAGDAGDPERLDAPTVARLLGVPLAG